MRLFLGELGSSPKIVELHKNSIDIDISNQQWPFKRKSMQNLGSDISGIKKVRATHPSFLSYQKNPTLNRADNFQNGMQGHCELAGLCASKTLL